MLRYIISLPFYLKFSPTQTFELKLPEKTIKLNFQNPKEVTFPPPPLTSLSFDSETPLTPDDLEDIRLFANRIFRAYRLVTKETFNSGVITQLAKHEFHRYILKGEIDENGNLVKSSVISYLKKLRIGVIEDQKYSEIMQLTDSPSLISKRTHDEILLEAKSFLDQENLRMAILEAVIALEIVVSSIIRKIAVQKGISEDETEDFLTATGLTKSLKIVLKLLVQESLPAKEIISECKGAITIRNGIVHKERMSVSPKEAQDAINNIEMLISHVQPLIDGQVESS